MTYKSGIDVSSQILLFVESPILDRYKDDMSFLSFLQESENRLLINVEPGSDYWLNLGKIMFKEEYWDGTQDKKMANLQGE